MMFQLVGTLDSLPQACRAEAMQPPRDDRRFDEFRQARYFGSLDGLRALCILAVIFHHAPPSEGLPGVLRLGFLGVDVFFVLSGVLIETLILRERSAIGSFSLTNFYVRRMLRIFPIYYLFLGIVLAGLVAARPGSAVLRDFLGDLPYYLTFTCNWTTIVGVNMSILWSLATEEQFYLIWPFIEKHIRPRIGFALLLGALAVNQAVNFGLAAGWAARIYGPGGEPCIFQITFTPIIFGVALGRLLHSPRPFRVLAQLVGGRLAPLGWAAALLGACWASPADLAGWPRLTIQLLITLLIGSLMIREDHVAAPVLGWKPLRRIGVISYGAYLYHMMGLHLARAALGAVGWHHPAAVLLGTLAVTFALAEASFRVVEAPFLRLKQRWMRTGGGLQGFGRARTRLARSWGARLGRDGLQRTG